MTQTIVPEPAETPLGCIQPTVEIINVDSPEILYGSSPPQQSTEGHDCPQIEEHPPPTMPPTEGRASSLNQAPLIEDISVSTFLTDTQHPLEQVDRPPLRLLPIGHKAASS